ncbi:MAG: hypothetical protein DPW13_11880 [Planctomycetes bacterium]|nr:hypothetical protein [Planctomycetota bacterium]
MDIEFLARKLQPLYPREVNAWMRTRDLDAGMRELVEQQIVSMAYRVFGDFRSRILLSLPPRAKSRGPLHVGTVLYERDKWSFALSPSELLQNLAVFGRSGAGKTNVVFHLIQQLARMNVPFLFLDWKRTGRHLLPLLKNHVAVFTPGRSLAPFAFNPLLLPPGVESSVYANHLVDVIADSFVLGEGARSLLHKAFNAVYAREHGDVEDALRELQQIPDKERVRAWKTSAVRALESLPRSLSTSKDAQKELAAQLVQRATILELDALSQSGRKFLVPLLCYWLYQVKLASTERERLSLVIVVEEAHHVLYRQENRAKESLMNMLLRQSRELGITFIIVDQHPHLISSAALGNTYTTICLNLKDPSDINRAAGLCLLDEHEKRFLTMLPVGQGIMKLQDRWRLPFLLKFPLVPIHKGAVTDAVLQRFLASKSTGSGALRLLGRVSGRVQRVQAADNPLDMVMLGFMEDVLTHKDDGVKQRYQRLGLSVGRGNSMKERLVADGWLEESVVPIERTRKVVLRLTAKARAALGLDSATRRESLPHEYWKRFYQKLLENGGYAVTVEASRQKGASDLVAESGRKRIGIEVETGLSNAVENVRQDLREGFERVLVVATDEKAFDRVSRQLARAGLLIPSRVEVIEAKNWKEVAWLRM